MPQWTPEEAREMARKGAEARWEKDRKEKQLAADVRARRAFERAAPGLADELVKAARGEPPYDELDVLERVKLMQKCLEFGIGRPGSVRPAPAPEEAPEGDGAGFHIGGGDE